MTMPASVYLINPLTEDAKAWIHEHLPCEDWQMMGNAHAVEWRYLDDILAGMADAGLQKGTDYTVVS